MKKVFIVPIVVYKRFLSPFFGVSCRHYPTCSTYAEQAIQRHGVLKGLFLSFMRILSCHPFSKKSSIDPVPKDFTFGSSIRYKAHNLRQKIHIQSTKKAKE